MNRIRRRLRALIKRCDANRGGKCPVLVAITRDDAGAKPSGDAP